LLAYGLAHAVGERTSVGMPTIRQSLGDARFEETSARGAAMSYDEVVSFAEEICSEVLNDDSVEP
jgi:hypothetical protein